MNKPEMTSDKLADRERLILDVKNLIVDSVNLHHMNLDAIQADTPFGPSGLNLDSVDILEVVVAVENKFQIKVKDAEIGRRHFVTIGGIADFLMEARS